ncbi:membrane protein insertase YidC [Thiopseudomonas acetoxidans]|uniref:Membrane protein insertase YidC n=1 Tax=Thiopseudomonas acetoxidans TaxID=3041622 RepID=A0ABT7SMX2_9GAMM|nr:membrane protein insertase YidC [Thiopseudomonas sp. CY1220]MDM7857531.1 membrane protein insertase YidC [Thiopseudomonas sp. CY1220]
MDIQRTFLIVALAIVTYALVLQWNQDYGQVADNPSVTISSSAQQQPAVQHFNTVNTTDTKNNEDFSVPAAVANASQEAPNTLNQDLTPSNTGLIYVKTDVLELAVDPVGGDIVELKLSQYPRQAKNPDIPLQLFENSSERVYIAQSGLMGKNGPDASGERPHYSTEKQYYQLVEGEDSLNVDFTFSKNNVNYTKRFTFHRGYNQSCTERQIEQRKKECMNELGYQIGVTYLVDNQSNENWQGSLLARIKRDGQGDPSSTTATNTATYLGAAVWTPDEPYKKLKMGMMDDKEFKQKVEGGWVAWLQHYFVAAWVPDSGTTNTMFSQRRVEPSKFYVVGYASPEVQVAPGEHYQFKSTLYAGPKIQSHLKKLSPGLELTVDYGFLWFIAQPIFWLLTFIHSLLGNWGWSIILLTVIIKLIFFPLSAASYKSMARMRGLAPKVQALKDSCGDDKQKLSQGMMELYKKEKVNPLGGCLPILVQMPVFLSLYWVLLESVEMRQVPWMLWLTDLSSKDPYFILPIIMGISMFVQQKLNPAPPDPMQAKVMKMLPIIFTFFFLWFPAGLVLYWVVNNILSIAQQWYITRKVERAMATKA